MDKGVLTRVRKPRNWKFKAQRLKTAAAKANIWYRILSCFGCIVYVVGCLYQSFTFLAIYFEYPTTIEINVLQEPIINFPAVTICNGNRVRKSAWCKYYSEACQPAPEDSNQAQEFIAKLTDAYHYLNRSMRIELGVRKKEFIRSCQYEDMSCMDLIGYFFNYEYTNCFTINSHWANKSQDPLTSSMFRPRSGRSSEMLVLLDVQKEEYTPIDRAIRARMTIHSRKTIPNPQYDGVSLQTGNTYNYGVKKNIVNVLPRPYQTNCKNYTGLRELRTNATMTQEDCVSHCCAYHHLQYCSCTVHRLSLIFDIRTCNNPAEDKCLVEVDQKVKYKCYNECRMPCSKVTYSYDSVNSFPLQQGVCSEEVMNDKPLTIQERENLICLRVFFSSAESEIYSHKPKYNGIQVFSIIGGYIGLWLGISFLNVHNYLMNTLHSYFIKKRNRKITQN